MMIVRATRDLAKDEEVTFSYRNLVSGFDDIRKRTRDHWGFTCNCDLCKLELKSSNQSRKRREALKKDLIATIPASPASITASGLAKIERLSKELANTYDEKIFADRPRLDLAQVTNALTSIYATRGNVDMVEEYAWATMHNLGFKSLPGLSANFDRSKALTINACVEASIHLASIAAVRGKEWTVTLFWQGRKSSTRSATARMIPSGRTLVISCH